MKKADIYVICAGVLWAFTGIIFQFLALFGFTRMGSVAIRLIVACLGMLVVCLARGKRLFCIAAKDLLYCAGSGVLGLAMFNFAYFSTISMTSLSIAAAFLYTSPVFVMLLSHIAYKEPLTKPKLLALGATILGNILITGTVSQAGLLSWLAIAMGLLTGFGYALYNLLSKVPLERNAPEVVTFYIMLFGMLAAFFLEPPSKIFPLLNGSAAIITALTLGLMCCMLPSLLFSKGLAGSDPSRTSILVSSELVVATLLGFIKGDPVGFEQIAGLILLLIAVIIVNVKPRHRCLISSDQQKAQG